MAAAALALEVDDEEAPSSSGSEDEKDAIVAECEPFPEGVYACTVCCFIRDMHFIASFPETKAYMKFTRLTVVPLMCFLTLSLQAYLISCTKALVTPFAVKEARELYSKYEQIMYTDGSGKEWTYYTLNGYARGIDGHFNASNFAHLNEGEKDTTCAIPISQPLFFCVILQLWSMTCLAEMRKSIAMGIRLCYGLPTSSDMCKALVWTNKETGEAEVVSLPAWIKFFLTFIAVVPRLAMSGYLLWLGSRWLMATPSFGDCLLNAVALEFILLLRETVYFVMVPFRMQRDTQTLLFPPSHKIHDPTVCNYFGMFALFVVGLTWTLLYMFKLQQVLPDYNFDVHKVCEAYLAEVRYET